jgi:hypothetical protein
VPTANFLWRGKVDLAIEPWSRASFVVTGNFLHEHHDAAPLISIPKHKCINGCSKNAGCLKSRIF